MFEFSKKWRERTTVQKNDHDLRGLISANQTHFFKGEFRLDEKLIGTSLHMNTPHENGLSFGDPQR